DVARRRRLLPQARDRRRGLRRGRPAPGRDRAEAGGAPLGEGFCAGLRDGLELVADAVARLDERVPRRAPVDLLAQAAHEDVDRAVAVRLAAAPQLLQKLVARGDAALIERELVEQPE